MSSSSRSSPGSLPRGPRLLSAGWLASCALLAALLPATAVAQPVETLVVRFGDRALPAGATALPVALQAMLDAALGVPAKVTGRTRDGAFELRLAVPVEPGQARAALNRVRLDAAVLYVNAARPAPEPATTGRPTDRLIVRYRAGAATTRATGAPLDEGRVTRLAARAGVPLSWRRTAHDGADVLQMLHRRPIAEVEAIAARIAQDPDVDYAQPDYIRTRQAVPTDPCYASPSIIACSNGWQWDLFDPVGGINMPAAWDVTTGSAAIRVGVIDTGILFSHPDLAGRVIAGYDTIEDCAVANDNQTVPCTWSNFEPAFDSVDGDAADPGDWVTPAENAGLGVSAPYDWFQDCGADDSSWHGTHVAGTIAAKPNNGIGIAGINWVSQILPLRVLGKCGGYSSDINAAVVWGAGGTVPGLPANPTPARVLNLSLGGDGSCDPATQSAVNTALGLGAVVVVAAGNDNGNASSHSPASCNGVVTVAATTKNGRRARYSNYGAAVEIAAPGGNADGADPDILSTLNNGATSPNAGGYNYVRYAGTSMATPHVAGVVSLMLSVNPALTPAQVLAKLQSTARVFPTPGPACNATPQASACNCTTALCGAGILDAAAAVLSAAGGGTQLASSANPSQGGVAVTFTATVVGTAPTGTVRFEDGAAAIAGCAAVALTGAGSTRTAACVTSSLAFGSHTIKATYSGGGGNPASSATLVQSVVPIVTTTVTSSANPQFVGTPVMFTAAVSGNAPTGTVAFADGATPLAGCTAVPLTGTGNTRTAACVAGALAAGAHTINVAYSGDGGNSPANGALAQSIASLVPGTATIVSNPYGPVTVQGATLVGNTISNLSGNVVIQLGNVPGSPSVAAEIDFQGFNVAPGGMLTIRSGAAGQFVYLVDKGTRPSLVGGLIGANDFSPGSVGFPVLYLKNPNGITISAGGYIGSHGGLGLDTLGSSWTVGQPLMNNGVVEGPNLEIFAAKITGGGEFRADAATVHTFGNANNPVHGSYFLQNGLRLQPSTGTVNTVALTLNAYGTAPQVLNFYVGGNVSLWMPSAWPAGSPWPQNNPVVAPAGIRPAGQPDPGYGGGSMLVQTNGALTLANGGTHDLAFPGGIVLKSDGPLDLNGVALNQGWTTSGQSFQGVFLESPAIRSSTGNIVVYGNDLNWVNFSTFPQTPVRAFTLVRKPDGSATFAAADATAPHLNTYSTLSNAAAAGGCWTCLVNTQPVNMFGP